MQCGVAQVIVAAGMEGALPSVVAGMVDAPVRTVWTLHSNLCVLSSWHTTCARGVRMGVYACML
jgi:NCAIR mutase (PurE)-related protein